MQRPVRAELVVRALQDPPDRRVGQRAMLCPKRQPPRAFTARALLVLLVET